MQIEREKVIFNIELDDDEVKALLFALILANKKYEDANSDLEIEGMHGERIRVSVSDLRNCETILQSLYNSQIAK